MAAKEKLVPIVYALLGLFDVLIVMVSTLLMQKLDVAKWT
jgi:hypothetical protein